MDMKLHQVMRPGYLKEMAAVAAKPATREIGQSAFNIVCDAIAKDGITEEPQFQEILGISKAEYLDLIFHYPG